MWKKIFLNEMVFLFLIITISFFAKIESNIIVFCFVFFVVIKSLVFKTSLLIGIRNSKKAKELISNTLLFLNDKDKNKEQTTINQYKAVYFITGVQYFINSYLSFLILKSPSLIILFFILGILHFIISLFFLRFISRIKN